MKMVRKNEQGFTLVELMITMVIFVIVIAAASQIFSSLLNQFKQQAKIVETNIEGVIGLEVMRTDVEQAGYGLSWNVEHTAPEDGADDWNSLANYSETLAAAALPAPYATTPALFNDGAPASALPLPANQRRAPRAILGGNNLGLFAVDPADNSSSDYLVIKATSVGMSETSQQWNYIADTAAGYIVANWGAAREDLVNNNRVIVMRPTMGVGAASQRVLIADSPNTLFALYDVSGGGAMTNFRPFTDSRQVHLVYGVDPNTNLRMPFNRADYYVRTPVGIPTRCAPNTGVLYKATVNQADGALTEVPLLDCVADMQIVFQTDTNNDGVLESNNADWANGLTAQEIREQVRSVAIYVLAHEGQRDTAFTFTNFTGNTCTTGSCIRVGDFNGALFGRDFDLRGIIGDTFANYRWKVYTLGVTLYNLR